MLPSLRCGAIGHIGLVSEENGADCNMFAIVVVAEKYEGRKYAIPELGG